MKIKVLLVCAGIGVAMAMVEIALRVGGIYKEPGYPPKCPWDISICGLYEEYEPHGYRLVPSLREEYMYPPRNPRRLTVVSNKYGFRSKREFDESDKRLRIIVLGDSFVFGDGVEESERFTNVLERLQPTWRVDNLGMTGYGPGLMLRALEQVGIGLKPDVVLFSMYTDDFRRVYPFYAGVGGMTARFKFEAGKLVTIPYPEPRAWDHLRIIQLLRRAYWKYTDTERKINSAILNRFLQLSKLYSFAPAIIFLPAYYDTNNDRERRGWLRRYAESYDTPFLDLTVSIHEAGSRQVFIKGNPHLNPYGHQIIAGELRRFLADQVLNHR